MTKSEADAFVIKTFINLFGREPKQDGIDWWSKVLMNQGADDFESLVLAGAYSDTGLPSDVEFYEMKNANPDIAAAFRAENGREPLANEFNDWVTKSKTEEPVTGVPNTADDTVVDTATGGNNQEWTREKADKFVLETFNKMFGRDPMEAGLAHWSEIIQKNGTDNIEEDMLAGAAQGDKSYYNKTLKYPQIVEDYYYLYGRYPKRAGFYYWTDMLEDPESGITLDNLRDSIKGGSSDDDINKHDGLHPDDPIIPGNPNAPGTIKPIDNGEDKPPTVEPYEPAPFKPYVPEKDDTNYIPDLPARVDKQYITPDPTVSNYKPEIPNFAGTGLLKTNPGNGLLSQRRLKW